MCVWVPSLFSEIPGSGGRGVHRELRPTSGLQGGDNFVGKLFLPGRGEAVGDSSTRRAPLAGYSALLASALLRGSGVGRD